MFDPKKFTVRDETFDIAFAFNRKIDVLDPPPPAPKVGTKKYDVDGEVKTIQKLYGYKGKRGCFSVMKVYGGRLDVALYDCAPEEVNDVAVYNAEYVDVENSPGWGYVAVEHLKEMLNRYAKYLGELA